MSNDLQLTSTTAPGKLFGSREELAEHYRSDWHRYNLKRRQAGLPMLAEADFAARLAAAQAMQAETKASGTDHLKKNKKNKQKKNGVVQQSQAAAYDRIKKERDEQTTAEEAPEPDTMEEEAGDTSVEAPDGVEMKHEEEETEIEIDPRQCLFDRHVSASVEANVDRMYRRYGFFVPDREHLDDLEGLVGYCHEKIRLGHMCLYCERVFATVGGVQKHMIGKRHCKLRYEAGYDLEDLDVFYDFETANAEFLGRPVREEKEEDNEGDVVDQGEWEDVSDDDELPADEDDAEMAEDDDDIYDGYEEQVASMGFDVTPLGELVFPDGRIIGHRALRRYYKQRPRVHEESAAVAAARQAAGERLYRGRVYQLTGPGMGSSAELTDDKALALANAGLSPGIAAGRAGKGILVADGKTWSQLSVYRYRAAVRKQRRGQDSGRRLHDRSMVNMNRMDKKANRLMNGVSVAHAAR